MDISELTAYAEEKYHMQEQHKWADFPGFSVLVHPDTDKWVALLMRQWDTDTGTELQRCDIKCGRDCLSGTNEGYLSAPFRMKGGNWVGVIFDDRTDPDLIFSLLDRAMQLRKKPEIQQGMVFGGARRGYTVVLEDSVPGRKEKTSPVPLYRETPIPSPLTKYVSPEAQIPEKIRKMRKLYEYGDGSFSRKCRNFCRQGKFMEDYEDDALWTGEYRQYFPVYHDLNLRQLRGYFAWRTLLRKGDWRPVTVSLAYIYVYELLNGIGAASPAESLRKLKEFEAGFLDAGYGDDSMRRNLHRWMLQFAVLHDVSPETASLYMDPKTAEEDHSLQILKRPDIHTDEEVFSALCFFCGEKLKKNQVVKKEEEKGKRLFAAVWRLMSEKCVLDGRSFFERCFGEAAAFPWYPLSNAVYLREPDMKDREYILNDCRRYICRRGAWVEVCCRKIYYDPGLLRSVMHESERVFRSFFNIRPSLKKKEEEAFVTPYAEAVVESERRREAEERKPVIRIDFTRLDGIRRDAGITRDSLLTEQERGEMTDYADGSTGAGGQPEKPAESGRLHEDGSALEAGAVHEGESASESGAVHEGERAAEAGAVHEDEKQISGCQVDLDEVHIRLLLSFLAGRDAKEDMRALLLMPAVVADTINEAFFDEIGDNILECDGDDISVVEDYREDVCQLLGGNSG